MKNKFGITFKVQVPFLKETNLENVADIINKELSKRKINKDKYFITLNRLDNNTKKIGIICIRKSVVPEEISSIIGK